MFLMICILSLMISFLVMMISSLLSKKKEKKKENCTPFECGFDTFCSARMPFSIKFFLIAIIFLIFDVEIALILPMIITMKYSNMFMWTMTNFIFLLILFIGLIFEWQQGSLDWEK